MKNFDFKDLMAFGMFILALLTCDRGICGVSYAEIYVYAAGIMCYH